jgi:hypothetical protein
MFIIMHENLKKMKDEKVYDKYLFKQLEDNISLIYKENFELGKT